MRYTARQIQQDLSSLPVEPSTSAGKVTRTLEIKASEKLSGSDKCVQELLPGIPDEITLGKICTKLPWHVFDVLLSVSSSWQKAIATRQVYDARVRACSTETLMVHCHEPITRLALYSSVDKCCYELPPLPQGGRPGRFWSGCVVLDGKIYVLAPSKSPNYAGPRTHVYVLDVASRCTEWEQCARMRMERQGFGCGTAGGKIYVFGGTFCGTPMRESDVYDPELNSWTPIMRMKSARFGHRVAAIGEELFVYGGDVSRLKKNVRPSLSVEVYHSTKNEWREVGHCQVKRSDSLFVAKGEFHCMTASGVEVFDIDKGARTKRHTHCFHESNIDVDPDHFLGIGPNSPTSVVAVDNDLFATVSYRETDLKLALVQSKLALVQCQRFDRCEDEIVWLDTGCPCPSHDFDLQGSINL